VQLSEQALQYRRLDVIIKICVIRFWLYSYNECVYWLGNKSLSVQWAGTFIIHA